MRMPVAVYAQEARRFYDGGVDADADRPEIPPDPDADPQIELRRVTAHGVESFEMLRRIAYRDREYGEILVPRETGSFETDLTSVPWLFTWLVPKTGAHLPAALLHDGLVFPPGTPPTYTSTEGHTILRADADRILRAAMADTGTGLVRRWLVWSAVTAATMLSGAGTGWSRATSWRHRTAVAGTVVVVVVLGALATLELFDLDPAWMPDLPWMPGGSFADELWHGLAGAVVIPLVLGLAWGRFRVAGWVVGVALAVLLHVTVVLLLLTFGYRGLELVARKAPLLLAGATVVVVAAAGVLFVTALS